MDPTAVVGLVASCAKLADIILKTTTTLNALRGRFSTSEIAVTSLVTQLQALEASTSELRSLLQDRGPSVSQSEKLVTSLDACLISATTIIQPLRDQVSEAWSSIDSVAFLRNDADRTAALDDEDNAAVLQRARDDSSSLIWLRDADSRASFVSFQSDTLSRLSMVFGFDHDVMDSAPYRRAVTTAWKRLRERQKEDPNREAPHAVTRGEDIESPATDDPLPPTTLNHLGGMRYSLAMIVAYDFEATRSDELDCRTGEILIPCALSNDEWVVAKPISRLGGPGLVPINFLSVVARSGKICETVEEALREFRKVGLPRIEEWKKRAAKYKEEFILLSETPEAPATKAE
ncbi:hypothetical protein ACCO45_004890 [Purpureocillium lilacinum]|uniref:Uncharacterized protein n=1 Tax=Purpureocillium lilacinum TaxID=33203 RepID=A0ACC4DUJ1_PURLI